MELWTRIKMLQLASIIFFPWKFYTQFSKILSVSANGARLLCTQDANMTYQIEYESVPESEYMSAWQDNRIIVWFYAFLRKQANVTSMNIILVTMYSIL